MNKIRVYTVKCRRGCGKVLATTNRSIWGVPQHVREKYQGICGDCLTPEEHREIFEATQQAVAGKVQKCVS
jgi:hypothetical protein